MMPRRSSHAVLLLTSALLLPRRLHAREDDYCCAGSAVQSPGAPCTPLQVNLLPGLAGNLTSSTIATAGSFYSAPNRNLFAGAGNDAFFAIALPDNVASVSFSTCDPTTTFDTQLTAYVALQGRASGEPVALRSTRLQAGSNDDAGAACPTQPGALVEGARTSILNINKPQAFSTLYIVVDSKFAIGGSFMLKWNVNVAPLPGVTPSPAAPIPPPSQPGPCAALPTLLPQGVTATPSPFTRSTTSTATPTSTTSPTSTPSSSLTSSATPTPSLTASVSPRPPTAVLVGWGSYSPVAMFAGDVCVLSGAAAGAVSCMNSRPALAYTASPFVALTASLDAYPPTLYALRLDGSVSACALNISTNAAARSPQCLNVTLPQFPPPGSLSTATVTLATTNSSVGGNLTATSVVNVTSDALYALSPGGGGCAYGLSTLGLVEAASFEGAGAPCAAAVTAAEAAATALGASFIFVSGQPTSACAIYAGSGAVACFSGGDAGLTSLPPTSNAVFIAQGGRNASCSLDYDGALTCWGANASTLSAVPDGARLSFLRIGGPTGSGACGIKIAGGGVLCWGALPPATLRGPPPSLAPYQFLTSESVNSSHFCAVSNASTLECWGHIASTAFAITTQQQMSAWASTVRVPSPPPPSVTSGWVGNGGGSGGGGGGRGEAIPFPPPPPFVLVNVQRWAPIAMSATPPVVCALNTSSPLAAPVIRCSLPATQANAPNATASPGGTGGGGATWSALTASLTAPTIFYALGSDGSTVAWGANSASPPPFQVMNASLAPFLSISGGFLCALGIDTFSSVIASSVSACGPPRGPYSSVVPQAVSQSVGGVGSVCALRLDGVVECWSPSAIYSPPLQPLGTSPQVFIAQGGDVSCALNALGLTSCFANFGLGGAVSPAWSISSPLRLVVLTFAAPGGCGIAADWSLLCWGAAAVTPPPIGLYNFLTSAGGTFFCAAALHTRQVVCWEGGGSASVDTSITAWSATMGLSVTQRGLPPSASSSPTPTGTGTPTGTSTGTPSQTPTSTISKATPSQTRTPSHSPTPSRTATSTMTTKPSASVSRSPIPSAFDSTIEFRIIIIVRGGCSTFVYASSLGGDPTVRVLLRKDLCSALDDCRSAASVQLIGLVYSDCSSQRLPPDYSNAGGDDNDAPGLLFLDNVIVSNRILLESGNCSDKNGRAMAASGGVTMELRFYNEVSEKAPAALASITSLLNNVTRLQAVLARTLLAISVSSGIDVSLFVVQPLAGAPTLVSLASPTPTPSLSPSPRPPDAQPWTPSSGVSIGIGIAVGVVTAVACAAGVMLALQQRQRRLAAGATSLGASLRAASGDNKLLLSPLPSSTRAKQHELRSLAMLASAATAPVPPDGTGVGVKGVVGNHNRLHHMFPTSGSAPIVSPTALASRPLAAYRSSHVAWSFRTQPLERALNGAGSAAVAASVSAAVPSDASI